MMMMSLQCSPFPNCQRLMFKPLPQTSFIFRSHEAIHEPITKPRSRRRQRLLIASAAPEALVADPPPPTDESKSSPSQSPTVTAEAEKPGGKVKGTTEKPRLVLKFIWMEKNIGVGLNQLIPAHGTVPLSPYYFWPRKDAWEELKLCLESKPWISQKTMIILLNQATDIINLWQQSGGNLSSQ